MRKSIARLHYITRETPGWDLIQDVESACKGGVRWVQLRLKKRSEGEISSIAKEIKIICKKYSAVFIVNDYVNLAIEIDADGVHLGKMDMPVSVARKLLGKDKIIGGSTNSFEDILKASEYGVDYIGLGPVRFTTTKENLNPVLGEVGIRTIIEKLKGAKIQLPVIAIGGIQLSDVENLMDTGVYGVAVSSAINNSDNTESEAKRFIDTLIPKNEAVENAVVKF
jgi:thiamine-phosphate diphosphorylase